MSRKKRIELNSDSVQNNPFASLDVSFSEEEISAYEESKENENVESGFPGGIVKVRIEKKGRGGKAVTVYYGFEKDQGDSLNELLAGLKKALATGGKLTEEGLELQGDLRKQSSEWLKQQGYKVKGQIS